MLHNATRCRMCVIALGVALVVASSAANSQGAKSSQACALALVLAVDLSASVNMWEYDLQTQGFVEAFRHPGVIDVIESVGPDGIWVTLLHWSGIGEQVQSVPWTRVWDRLTAYDFAAAIAAVPRPYNDIRSEGVGTGTALGSALRFAGGLFASPGPRHCDRRVIDVSGDGRSNIGLIPGPLRAGLVGQGFTINGLAILSDEPDLDDYYHREITGGPASFVMSASGHETFAAAIRNKLIREIAPRLASRTPQREKRLASPNPLR